MNKQLKTVSLETMIDKHIGKQGTKKREAFESKLTVVLKAHTIKLTKK